MKLSDVNKKLINIKDLTLEYLTLEQFFLVSVNKSNAQNIIEDISELKTTYSQEKSKKTESRNLAIEEITVKNLKDQFLKQYKGRKIKGKDFNELLEKAINKLPENPNSIVELSKNKYIVGTNSSDSITLRLVSHSAGSLLLFKPDCFKIIELEK